jgi:hypothetical protein
MKENSYCTGKRAIEVRRQAHEGVKSLRGHSAGCWLLVHGCGALWAGHLSVGNNWERTEESFLAKLPRNSFKWRHPPPCPARLNRNQFLLGE